MHAALCYDVHAQVDDRCPGTQVQSSQAACAGNPSTQGSPAILRMGLPPDAMSDPSALHDAALDTVPYIQGLLPHRLSVCMVPQPHARMVTVLAWHAFPL